MPFSTSKPFKLQLTPGPTSIHPDVQEAVGRQLLNHTDPEFLGECTAVKGMLKQLFGTHNEATGVFTSSGTGGNEAGVTNFVYPNDKALYVNSGFFSGRIGDMLSRRSPAEIIELQTAHDATIDPNKFEDVLARHGRGGVSAAYLAHIETSAGTQIPDSDLVALGEIATRYDVMLCIDAVCAFGGVPVNADAWQAAYISACSQKGVNSTPGTAPFTAAPFAMERIAERKRKGQLPGSFYFDLEENMKFWEGGEYHITPAVNGIFALHKALQMTLDRAGGDLPTLFRQHEINQRALEVGLEELGFINPVELSRRAAVVSVLRTPVGKNADEIRKKLLQVQQVRGTPIAGLEVALGKWDPEHTIRMALLGLFSNPQTVLDACDAFSQVLGSNGKAIAAAERYLREHGLL